MSFRFPWLAGLCALCLAGTAQAETVRVFTSYPQDMMDLYEQAFAKVRPDIQLDFQWGHAPDALTTLRRPDQGGVDVWWSPASNAFPVLAREGGLRRLGELAKGVETQVWGMPLGDAKGTYTAFEIAGYGFVLRPDYLARNHLQVPEDWPDLAKPDYAGHVVLPVPSTIGYAPAMIEIPLQHMGWDKGWGLWAAIAANAELMDGGGGVAMINELAEGEKGIGLVMDFFVRPAKAEGKPVVFVYPAVSAVNPAHVGITAKAPHPEAAAAFVRFVLSEEGQRLLMSHGVARLPVRRALYASAPADYPRPFAARRPTTVYDPDKALARQPVLKVLFDAYITDRHDRLVALFAAIRKAEARGEQAKADKARALALELPVSEAEAADAALNAPVDRSDGEAAQALRAKWGAVVSANTARAFAVLEP